MTCPACAVKRQHTREELGPPHHPLAGHGYTREQGASCEECWPPGVPRPEWWLRKLGAADALKEEVLEMGEKKGESK